MRKTIRKIGDSLGIIFNKEEARAYNLIIGNLIEIEIKQILIENSQSAYARSA